VEGEAGVMARRVGLAPVVGESGSVTHVDNGLLGVCGMVGN
jgi:hypothetical protein